MWRQDEQKDDDKANKRFNKNNINLMYFHKWIIIIAFF
jgi:hypothetical protein